MPLMITTRRSARTIEPNIKSSDPDFLIFANAKHEIKFHCTITSGGQLFVQTLPHNTGRRTVQDKFPPLDYLEADHITVEAVGLSQETAEALGIGYAPMGMMKGYVAIPIGLPTGELTGYIGITEGKVPKEFHLSNVVTFPKKTA